MLLALRAGGVPNGRPGDPLLRECNESPQRILFQDGPIGIANGEAWAPHFLSRCGRLTADGEDCPKFHSSWARNGTSSATEQMRRLVRSGRSV